MRALRRTDYAGAACATRREAMEASVTRFVILTMDGDWYEPRD